MEQRPLIRADQRDQQVAKGRMPNLDPNIHLPKLPPNSQEPHLVGSATIHSALGTNSD